jgi:hypothetical protein
MLVFRSGEGKREITQHRASSEFRLEKLASNRSQQLE